VRSRSTLCPKGRYPVHCLSLGRGGAWPGGCERGGYLPIPRRDERAGGVGIFQVNIT